ncbi:TIGR03503 family protein [Vibrio sp. JC009]|uniref:TIGR03503 family protein n=1 Tax=Vibrio sp. JC009 TaxID=2912314 RepID=UPI0023B092EA|nr:TIGR03503 family protein [Vibrio sp. JC009]WED21157.1 TIGR03503 family protein [Vibrio sp. JC009]
MLRILFTIIGLLFSVQVWSQAEEATFSILDNRFRIDPKIDQVSFVIYREVPSRSSILVRPDGTKYYAWKHPENVSWFSDKSMDIISVVKPMPGPWQAIGKITPKNNITLLSDVKLDVDDFPSRLYQSEKIKFTARLTYEDKPLKLKEFLDRVTLRVEFTPYLKDEELLKAEEKPKSVEIASFYDSGEGLDEIAGDGVFTVEIPITVDPGKYRARITSGNGVFMRAVEDTVLVYPSPVSATFVQSREEGVDHSMLVSGEQGLILPGTLAVHIEQAGPNNSKIVTQSSVAEDSFSMEFALPYDETPGKHTWKGTAYATEGAFQRELVIDLPGAGFSIMEKLDVEKQTQAFLKHQEEKKRQLELERIQRDREEARIDGMLIILIGNLVVILLGLIGWFLFSKLRIRKVAVPEMQLNAPPKS